MGKLKGFIGETLIYGFGNVFSRLSAMLLIPLYARYLGKIDYSNLVMLQSTFAILTFFLALNAGVFYYYYEYENTKFKKIVLTSWFYYQIAVAVIISIALFFSAPLLMKLFIITSSNEQIIQWCLVLLGLQLFPYIFNITNINYFRIERKPRSVIIVVLLEAFFTLILVYISLAILEEGLIYVLVSQIIARALVNVIYIKKAKLYIKIKYFSKKLLKKIYIYTWPFIVSSIFTWVIISVDKFIGAQALTDKTDVALLALAMQLALPITVLTDMVRMAVGPFVMSIRKESDAEQSYQMIYDLCIYASSVVAIGLILISPLLTYILADLSYIEVIYIIPLFAFSKVFALAANQFSISFNLAKKNIYILYSVIIAGAIGVLINIVLMKKFGYVVSGYSQVLSYLAMSIFLYYTGKKVAKLNIKLKYSIVQVLLLTVFLAFLFFINPRVENGNYLLLIISSVVFIFLLTMIYLKQHNISFNYLLNLVKSKTSK